MALTLIAAPAVEPISLDDAIGQTRVTNDDEDATLTFYIQAARQHLEGMNGGLGRAFITQQWRLSLDCFPASGAIALPLPPLQSVQSVTYIDGGGVEQPWAPSLYQVDPFSPPCPLFPAFGGYYPVARYVPNAVTITFTAGYGDEPEDVPAPLRLAVRALVAHYYENREPVLVGSSMEELPMHVQALVLPFWIPAY